MLQVIRRYIDLVAEAARRDPNGAAVVSEDRRLSYGELDDRVGRLGTGLRRQGLRVGDRVALLSDNELECLEIQAACVRSGFTLVSLNSRLAVPELEYILRDCAPSILIAGRREEDRCAQLGRRVGLSSLCTLGVPRSMTGYDSLLSSPGDLDADPLDLDLLTTILYTSGTSGRPKGAMIDRAGMTARVLVNALELQARPDDVFLECLPMFHISAFLAYAYAYVGATAVMLRSFSPRLCLEMIADEQVTSMVLVPTMIRMILDDPDLDLINTASLRLLIYGGAAIDPPLLRRALERFGCGFHQQYGMTETGAQSILRTWDHVPGDDQALASAGRDAVTFEVRVVDGDDRPLGVGGIGEVVCRGPAVMSGYWALEETTASTLRGGWMHTGDLGYRDERGLLHIVDRRNDLIITGGENVYPREVEAALGDLGIGEVAVIGLPDERWGHVVVGVIEGEAPSDEALATYLRERIAGYKVPRRWVRVDHLPRNASGKVLKTALRDALADR